MSESSQALHTAGGGARASILHSSCPSRWCVCIHPAQLRPIQGGQGMGGGAAWARVRAWVYAWV